MVSIFLCNKLYQWINNNVENSVLYLQYILTAHIWKHIISLSTYNIYDLEFKQFLVARYPNSRFRHSLPLNGGVFLPTLIFDNVLQSLVSCDWKRDCGFSEGKVVLKVVDNLTSIKVFHLVEMSKCFRLRIKSVCKSCKTCKNCKTFNSSLLFN